MMEFESPVLKQILFSEALKTPNWRRYYPYITNAGILTTEDLVETSDEILDGLKEKIPPIPLERVKTLKKNLVKIKLQRQNSFSTPLSENEFFDRFQFVPQFTCDQYLTDISMNNIQSEIEKATNTVLSTDYNGLTKHQAIFIALYCQESSSPNNSFYYLINQFLRERKEQLICIRSALYLLESGLRRLPLIEDVTWRGMNIAPDLNKFIVGKTVCFTSLCSTSLHKDQTLQFMEVPPKSGILKKTLFKLNMSNGVSIQKWSCWKREAEVVALFSSCWNVLKVEQDHEEFFDSIGPYHCDYYIELHQLDNEPLFRSNIVLTGLHLLSKIQYEKPENLKQNLLIFFINYPMQLHKKF